MRASSPSALILVLLLGGCAVAPKQLAVPGPLVATSQPLTTASPAEVELGPGPVVTGPTVEGSVGDGLNMAASVHRVFLALGIPTEVSLRASPGATRLNISFPEGLSPMQREEVRRVLQLMRRRVALR